MLRCGLLGKVRRQPPYMPSGWRSVLPLRVSDGDGLACAAAETDCERLAGGRGRLLDLLRECPGVAAQVVERERREVPRWSGACADNLSRGSCARLAQPVIARRTASAASARPVRVDACLGDGVLPDGAHSPPTCGVSHVLPLEPHEALERVGAELRDAERITTLCAGRGSSLVPSCHALSCTGSIGGVTRRQASVDR